MSRNFIQAGRRFVYTASVANKAGDLVYANGFFGVVQDDVAALAKGVLILEGVWELKNTFGGLFISGQRVFAVPSAIATTALLYFPATGVSSVPSGGVMIGRVFGATVAASGATAVARVQLLNPNGYQTAVPAA